MTLQGAAGSSVGFLAVMGFASDLWAVGQDVVRSTDGATFQTLTAPLEADTLWVTASQVWAAGFTSVIHRAR